MSTVRQALYGVALFAALALLLWGQAQRIDAADAHTDLALAAAAAASEDAARSLKTATTLLATLEQERKAQTALRTQQNRLRITLAKRQQTLEALKRENTELRDWAAQPLPATARQLRERPALTGADAYREWLSGSSAVPASGDAPDR